MNQLKNIGSDLLEKKLWPLAVLLVVALVALPFVIGRGGADPLPPAPVTPTTNVTAADGSKAEVTVQEVPAATAERNRSGKVRDPFVKVIKPVTPPTASASPSPSTPSNATPPSSPSPGGGSGSTGTPTTPPATGTGSPTTPAPKPAPKPDPLDTYRLRLAFGNTDNHTRVMDDVARLTPLPSAENPFFVFLGVLSENQKAVFLVSSDAKVTGDGTCKPNKDTCETVELAQGETEYFDITTPGGRAVQYVMHVRKIERRPASEAGTARASTARASAAGQDILRAAADAAVGPKSRTHAGMLRYRFLPKTGNLVRAKHGRALRITADGVEPQRRSAKHQPGVAVFRTRPKSPAK
jgi:hypothetical protein